MIHYYVIGGVLIAGIIALIPVLYVTNNVAPFAYPNARVRAMRAGLVRTEELLNLSSRPYNDIIYYLEQNHYPNLSNYTGADRSFASLDAALRTHLIQELEKILRVSPQQTKPFLKALLKKYDIQVVETVVRSLAANTNIKTDILHTTKVFTEEFSSRKQHTLQDLQNELKGTRVHEIISKHKQEIENNEFEQFEQDLDTYYFSQLLAASTSSYARGYTKRLIDSHNIALINKNRQAIIPGGKIPLSELNDLTEKQLLERIKAAGYNVTSSDKTILEREIQASLKKYAKDLLTKESLSEASIVGFVALKIINVRNTAILLKMKYHNLEAQEIREVVA